MFGLVNSDRLNVMSPYVASFEMVLVHDAVDAQFAHALYGLAAVALSYLMITSHADTHHSMETNTVFCDQRPR